MRHFLFLVLIVSPMGLFSQESVEQQIDSLQNIIQDNRLPDNDQAHELGRLLAISTDTVQTPTERAKTFGYPWNKENNLKFHFGVVNGYHEINEYQKSLGALAESEKFLGENISNRIEYTYSLALNQQRLNNFKKAKNLYEEVLELLEKEDDEAMRQDCYNNLAACEQELGNFEKAIDLQQNALSLAEKIKDTASIGKSLNNISVLYQKLDDYEKSLAYMRQSMRLDSLQNDRRGLSVGYLNYGITQRKLAREKNDTLGLEAAKQNYLRAMELAEETSYFQVKAAALANLINVENDLGNKASSIRYGLEALEFNKSIKNKYGIMLTSLNLGVTYNENGEFAKASPLINDALRLAEEMNFTLGVQEAQYALSDLYSGRGKYKEALTAFKEYTKIKDSIASTDVKNKVNELEIKFETEKKENEILQQRAQLAEKDLEVRRKNTLVYGSFGLAVLLGLLGYLFYNQQRLKNSQLKKEAELQTALARIETQNKLQEQRLRISRDLHDNIGSQLTFVASSVDSLQYGIKKTDANTADKLGNISAFTTQTIYELRDTIWAMNKTEITAEDLQVRIANFMDKANKAREDVKFNFTTAPSVLNKKFTSIQGMNIYRIIQEAVNNALKYAQATEVSVVMKPNNGKENDIALTISDNGIGFNETEIEAGNGLSNMRKRARELGGELQIRSQEGKGSTVQLQF